MEYNINKFSNRKFQFQEDDTLLRLPNVNPNKVSKKEIELITFDIENVFINGKLFSLKFFKENIYKKHIQYICLTKSQEQLNDFKAKNIYYIFPFLKYEDYSHLELKNQYELLVQKYNEYIKLFEFDNKYKTTQQQFVTILKFKQSRKLRFKSFLDNNFFFSVKTGFADIFKLLENREDRKIYQLDVNSMHPYAMIQNNFSSPRFLKYYEKNNIEDIINNTITNGIFNCVLSIKKDLNQKQYEFIKYLPFNLIKEQTSIPINITKIDKINILLHANEIKFYAKYFDIELQDGVYSKKSIEHPLKSWVLDTYQKRLNSTGFQKDFYKFILVLSHSIAMTFNSKSEVYDVNSLEVILEQEYQMFYKNQEFNNKYFQTKSLNENKIKFKYYNIKNSNNVYSLYSQVLANTRIHLLELYEKIYNSSNKFELCYCNIDSLHISIPIELEEQFKTILEDISSPTELGKLKVESISNRGIWFEPGRYWLFDKDKLVSFKNTIFNDNNEDYKCIFKKVFSYKNGKCKINYFSLFKSLQHKKLIIKNSNNEYVYQKDDNLVYNMMNNLNIYKKIFKRYIK